MDAKRGLPQIRGAGSVKVVYDQEQEKMLEELGAFDPSRSLVEFFDPLQSRSVPFDDRDPLALPTGWDLKLEPETGLHVIQSNGRGYKLPFVLRQRLRVDKANNRLIFRGFYREAGNDPLLLLNVLSDCEAKHLKAFDSLEAGETFACKCRYALDNYGAAAEFFLLDVQMISTGNVRGWGCAQRRFSRASPARTRRTWW